MQYGMETDVPASINFWLGMETAIPAQLGQSLTMVLNVYVTLILLWWIQVVLDAQTLSL